jgi:predicted ABC-class ATPase
VAQKVEVILIDDLDGGKAEESVRFGLDGVQYEIDLSAENAREMREALSRYTRAGRRTTQGKSKPGAASRNQEAARIREWAKANGYNVSARGRVSSEIAEAYRAAQR